MGNPPFQDSDLQDSDSNSKGRKLYLNISETFIKRMPEDGELIFLTPKTIANDKKKRLSLTDTLHVKSIDYRAQHDFAEGIQIIQWHIDNKYNGDITIIEDNLVSIRPYGYSLVEQKNVIPFQMFNRIKENGSKQKDKLFIGDISTNGFRHTVQSVFHPYKIVVNDIKDKIEYSSVKPKLFNTLKIAIHMGQTFDTHNYRLDRRNYAQYQNMIDVEDLTDTQIDNIKTFLFNKIIIELCKKFREIYATGFNNIIYFIRKIDVDKVYDINDVQKALAITDEELEWLLTPTIKMKKTKVKDIELYSSNRKDRVKDTAEVFTPDSRVQIMLNEFNIDWSNPPQDEKFIDPTCGTGNFLVAVALRGVPLHNIFGVDLMLDNIEIVKGRLTEIFGDTPDTTYHLERNIICADALTYHYDFYEYIPPPPPAIEITTVLF